MRRKVNFRIDSYCISKDANKNQLVIEGYKLPPPSKRVTLHQNNIKVLGAKIIFKHKKGDIECEVIRINHLKSFGEIRLHTSSILYPGHYVVTINYTGQLNEETLKSQHDPTK
jgi:hypothetical protein